MTVRENVFASKAEKRNYLKLRRAWGANYSLYHNLPFLSVFSTDDLVDMSDWRHPKPFSVGPEEVARLKKTSIDFTLCDDDDRPILCIEFDGLQEGFSVGTDYYASRNITQRSPWRRHITELKLKVAHGSLFPFFVVGSKEFADLDLTAGVTIVDGIVGEVMAIRESGIRFSDGFDPAEMGISQEDFDALPSQAKREVIEDWAIGVEVDAELSNNPIARQRAMLEHELGITSYSVEPLEYPAADFTTTIGDRASAFANAILFGSRIVLHTPDRGDVAADAWLPNFKSAGFSPYGLTEEIAGLLALLKLRRARKRSA